MTKFNLKTKALSSLKKGRSETLTPPNDSSLECSAVLILNPEKLTIKVKAKTADGKPIMVEGCKEATFKSWYPTTLTAIGTKVVLKGNITELQCNGTLDDGNQLTALNVQGLTALQELICYANKLNAEAFTKLFTDLPVYAEGDDVSAILYSEELGEEEGNCKDFNTLPELKTTFEDAKETKHWKMQKANASGYVEGI